MPNADPFECLQAIITKDFTAQEYLRGKRERLPLLITISRDYGAGGEKIAELLAGCLGIPVFDGDILTRVAEKAKLEKVLLEKHDEQTAAIGSSFIYSILSGSTTFVEAYRRNLYEVILELAGRDGIIIGRGAHLILSGKRIFRLRVVGSVGICADRVAAESNVSPAEAEHQVRLVNQQRAASIVSLFKDSFENCALDNATWFDLIVNTDHIAPEDAMPVVLLALQQAGFDLRKKATQRDHE